MKKPKRKSKILNIVLISCILLLSACTVALLVMLAGMRPPEGNTTLNRSGRISNDIAERSDTDETVPLPPPKEQIYTFLAAGKDKLYGNTDTIMMIRLDITNKSIRILSIPRDTLLNTGKKPRKINSSYLTGGIELFEKNVAELTGFYVNRYILFNLEGVEKMIDAIGGVDFDVPRNMNYEDPTQNLYIHLKKGYQHLDGGQAVELARFRSYSNGDIGRIGMQQELLKALARQALKAENLLKLPELISLIQENVETDIDFSELVWLADKVKDMPVGAIEANTVPGTADTIEGISYWLPYKNELLELINSRFNPLDEPITPEDISVAAYSSNKGR